MEKKNQVHRRTSQKNSVLFRKAKCKGKNKKHAGEDSRIVYPKKGTAAPQLEGFPLLLFGVECRFQITRSIPSLRIW